MPGIEISNSVVAIVGTVALVGIGAHLLGKWLAPKPDHAIHVARQTDEPTIYEAMYGEAVATATHPETVHRNADRVHAAIRQRSPRIQELVGRAHRGDIGPDQVAEGVRANVHDVLDQLEIPSNPHPSAASPELIRLFHNQRQHHLTNRFAVPGGLILDPYERRYLEHQSMALVGETDPQMRVMLADRQRQAKDRQRLAGLRQHQAHRQSVIDGLDQGVRLQQLRAPAFDVQADRLGIA